MKNDNLLNPGNVEAVTLGLLPQAPIDGSDNPGGPCGHVGLTIPSNARRFTALCEMSGRPSPLLGTNVQQ